jgi:tetratricopeptide (TPR) repeat protein
MDLSRVVDVSARTPAGDISFGSGYLIAPGLVLTARHVTCADNGEPYDSIYIRFLDHDTRIPCEIAWHGDSDLDASLLRCEPRDQEDPPVRWGQLIASQAGVACEAAGFPRSMRQDDGLRDVEHLRGEINPGTGLLGQRIYVDVASAPPRSGEWEGMSGASLWCGAVLVGVVVHDVAAFASRRLAAESAGRLAANAEFEAALGGNMRVEAAELALPVPRLRRAGPAYLLRAEAQTARFRSRAAELAGLTAWCEGPGVRVQLLTGPGGQGKTRLARELTGRLGWVSVWLADGTSLPEGIRHPLLVIVDYAETRPEQVAHVILKALSQSGHVPVRILLLARSAGDWWERLRNQTAELEIGLAGTPVQALAVLEGSPDGRRDAFADALVDYDRALTEMEWPHLAPEEIAPPDFAEPALGSALQLQMAALAGLLGRDHPHEPAEKVILRHESRYWIRSAGPHGIRLHEITLRNAVAAVTLCGAASQAEAIALLSQVPGLGDQSDDVRLSGTRWLRDMYPPPIGPSDRDAAPAGTSPYWGSLQPDVLAEHLVATVAEELSGFLPGLLATTSRTQDHQALTVLSRASVSREGLASALVPLFLSMPKLALPAVDVATQAERPAPLLAALSDLVVRGALSTEVLTEIARGIPESTQTLASFAVTVQRMLVADYQAKGTPDGYPASLAIEQAALARRLMLAGQVREALAEGRRAVAMLEELAALEPRFLPNLAAAVNNLGGQLVDSGRTDEAASTFRRAVDIREQLPDAYSNAMLPDLAGSITNLAILMAAKGQGVEALAQIQRAVTIFEQLADAGIDVNDRTSGMAFTLAVQAKLLNDAGRATQALSVAQQAVAAYERLAETSPDAWRPSLASALITLSASLTYAGRHNESLSAGKRAVDILRNLAEVLPDAYLPRLAIAQRSISKTLAEAGSRQEALSASRQAVDIQEQLTAINPSAYRHELASSLNSLANDLNACGQVDAATTASRRAVALYEQASQVEPGPHLEGLGMSLLTLSVLLGSSGPSQEAIELGEKSVAAYEQLAGSDLPAHRAGLAASLNNLAAYLGDLGRHEKAIAAAQRAVGLCEALVAELPDVFRPELAAKLGTLASQLFLARRAGDAVAPGERAVEICEQIAATHNVHLPNLAKSLSNIAVFYENAGRPDDALRAIQRTVDLYDRLAEGDPEGYLAKLAEALHALDKKLANSGQREAAMEVSSRTVSIYKKLAAAQPQKYVPDLASALSSQSERLADLGNSEQGLQALRRAVSIYDTLAKDDEGSYLPMLAMLLNNLSTRLGEAGLHLESIDPARRAVRMYERLAQSDSEAYRPYVAESLLGLSLSLSHAGQAAEAVDVGERCVDIFTMLAEDDPAEHRGGLARALNSLSLRLAAAGRPQDAAAAGERAVEIDQQIEAANPGTNLPHLAKVLYSLAINLHAAGRQEDAFAAISRAAGIFAQLAAAGDASYFPYVGAALRSMAELAATPEQNAECITMIGKAITIGQRLLDSDQERSGSVTAQTLAELGEQLKYLKRRSGGSALDPPPASPGHSPDTQGRRAAATSHLFIEGSAEMLAKVMVIPHPGNEVWQPMLLLENEHRAWILGRENGPDPELNWLVEHGMTQLNFGAQIPGPARRWQLLLQTDTAVLLDPQRTAFYDGSCHQPAVWQALVRRTGTCLVLIGAMGLESPDSDFSSVASIMAMLDRAAGVGKLAGGFVAAEWAAVATEPGISKDRDRTEAAAGNTAEATATLERGNTLLDLGQLDGARAAYERAIASGHPDVAPTAAANLGVLLARQGDVAGARAAYQQAIDSGHSDAGPIATCNLGQLLEAAGELESARVAFEQAMDSGHLNMSPAAAVHLGDLRAEHGDPAGAKGAYQRAIESAHAEWATKAAMNLGVLHNKEGNTDGARFAFQQAVIFGDPEVAPLALFNLGLMFENEGNAQAAQATYQQLMASGHAEAAPAAAVRLGQLFMKSGGAEEAQAAFRQAIESAHLKYAPAATLRLGDLLFQAKDRNGAEAAYRQAIDSENGDASPAAAHRLGLLLAAEEDTGGALAAYEQAINSGHREVAPVALVSLGNLLARLGDNDGARAAYQLAIDSGHPAAAAEAAVNIRRLPR